MEIIYSRTTSSQVEQAWLDTRVPAGDLPLPRPSLLPSLHRVSQGLPELSATPGLQRGPTMLQAPCGLPP